MDSQELQDPAKQQDLFSEIIYETNPKDKNSQATSKNSASMSVNFDKILIFLLTCAIIFAFVFSFGIETGKKMTQEEKKKSQKDKESSIPLLVPQNLNESLVPLSELQEQVLSVGKEGGGAFLPEANLSTIPPPVTNSNVNTPETKFLPPPVDNVKKEAAKESPSAEIQEELPPYYWTIQIITYVNKAFANEEVKKFTSKGQDCFIISSGKYHQVCVGKYASREEAAKALEKFKKEKDYADAYLRKEKNN